MKRVFEINPILFVAALGAALVCAAPASGQILNPSFETTTGQTINNWTQTGNVGFLTSTFGKNPNDGSKMAYLVSQNAAIPGITSTPKVTAAALATALGTTTTALNTAAGAGNSVTAGAGATGGSGISQTINVTAGQTLLFKWDFLTSEDVVLGGNHNDYGFVSIDGVVTVLGRPDSAFHYVPFTGGAVDGSNVETYLFETGDGTGNAGQRTTDYNNNSVGNPALGFGAGKFNTFSHTFPSGGAVQVSFGVINVHTTGATSGDVPSALILDNLFLGVVPEPGTLALLGFGLGGAALAYRRRR